MNSLDYSPREILPLLDMWDELIWIKEDKSSNTVPKPTYYPFQILEWTVLQEAKQTIKGRKGKARELLAVLDETTFSKKAAAYIESAGIKRAVELLLEK